MKNARIKMSEAKAKNGLKKLNAINSENNLEYFGKYKGIEWTLTGERDGNKVWWTLKDSEGESEMPAPNLDLAIKVMIENIDYIVNNGN